MESGLGLAQGQEVSEERVGAPGLAVLVVKPGLCALRLSS